MSERKRSNSQIQQIEMLLTLDYLLNHTDIDHPATQIDICEHANNYGLKFDKNELKGNQVKRQRIAVCLKLLKEVCDKYFYDMPFVLETTDSGKYYIEQRHGLNETQVAKVLAAIKNDKYTSNEDVDYLSESILSAFSTSKNNKEIINNEYQKLVRGGKKYDEETLRKINLVEKAYRENKMIKIHYGVHDPYRKILVDYYFWYRVYMIKEFHNKLYTFMLPIGQINREERTGLLVFYNNYIFKPIEEIDIVNGPNREVLCDDEEDRDFIQLFKDQCPQLFKQYGSIDKLLEQAILPIGGKTSIVTFFFNANLLNVLKRSYNEFFSESLRYQKVCKVIVGGKDLTENNTNNFKYCVVNISVDINSFKSWLLSDPYATGQTCIADMITIIKPTKINELLAVYYVSKLSHQMNYLSNLSKEKIVIKINEL